MELNIPQITSSILDFKIPINWYFEIEIERAGGVIEKSTWTGRGVPKMSTFVHKGGEGSKMLKFITVVCKISPYSPEKFAKLEAVL